LITLDWNQIWSEKFSWNINDISATKFSRTIGDRSYTNGVLDDIMIPPSNVTNLSWSFWVDPKKYNFDWNLINNYTELKQLFIQGSSISPEDMLPFIPLCLNSLRINLGFRTQSVEKGQFDFTRILNEGKYDRLDLKCLDPKAIFKVSSKRPLTTELILETNENVDFDFKKFPNLELYVETMENSSSKEYRQLYKIKYLHLAGNELDLSFLKEFKNLKALILDNFKNITNLSFLKGLENLEYLGIMHGKNLENLDGIEYCPKLKYVFLQTRKKFDVRLLSKLDTKESILKFGYNRAGRGSLKNLMKDLNIEFKEKFSNDRLLPIITKDGRMEMSLHSRYFDS